MCTPGRAPRHAAGPLGHAPHAAASSTPRALVRIGPDSLCPSQADRALWTVQSRRTPPGSAGCRAGPPEAAAPRLGPALRVCGQQRPGLCALLRARPRGGQVGRPRPASSSPAAGRPSGWAGWAGGLWHRKASCSLTTVGPQRGRGDPWPGGGASCPPLPFGTAHNAAVAPSGPQTSLSWTVQHFAETCIRYQCLEIEELPPPPKKSMYFWLLWKQQMGPSGRARPASPPG